MTYTAKQITNAKSKYNAFLKLQSLSNYDLQTIGINEAQNRIEYHNNIVAAILRGDKVIEKEWKHFFLREEVKLDKKTATRKAKLLANKESSADVLAPIKNLRKLGEFGKWLNNSQNKFRKQHFTKKYSQEAVSAFLSL